MTDSRQLGTAGRLVLWILGTALFCVIALLPYAMYMRYAADATVLLTVQMATGAIFLLLWLGTVYGPLRTSPMFDTAGHAFEGGAEPASLPSKLVFIVLQILLIPLGIVAVLFLLAGMA